MAKRFSAGAVDFLRQVLQTVLAGLWRPPTNVPKALQSFRRVLIQDSTTLALAPKLAARFPGSRNQWQTGMASLKIQTVYDLLAETFVHFALTPFTTNDQKASPMILELARPGDLVIRDLGCAVGSVFQRAQAQQIQLLIYGRLIWISLFQVCLLRPLAQSGGLSLLKLAAWWQDYSLAWMLNGQSRLDGRHCLHLILYHCRYDRRRKRPNFHQKLESLS